MSVKDGKISAEVIGLTEGVVKRENMDAQFLIELQPTALEEADAEQLFDDIFNV